MKRTLIALGVAAAVVAPVANAAPKVYGKINVSVENSDRSFSGAGASTVPGAATADRKETRVSSNASRIGIKGEDELTKELSAVYQIEWGVNTDEATNAADFTPRNRFLGLKHADYGTVKIGQFDSYFKAAEGKVDQFNDLFGDFDKTAGGQDRLRSVVGYESPKIAGLQFNILTQGQDSTNGTAKKNGISSSVVFDDKETGIYAALAYNKSVLGASLIGSAAGSFANAGSREQDALRAVVGLNLGDLSLGALYQQSEASVTPAAKADDKESAYLVSAAYKIDDVVLKAQYAVGERKDDLAAGAAGVNKRTSTSIGADYNLTSKTSVQSFFTQVKEEGQVVAGTYEGKDNVIGLGLSHSF